MKILRGAEQPTVLWIFYLVDPEYSGDPPL